LLALASWPGIAATQDEFSVPQKNFDDAANRAEVAAALDSLANHAAVIEEHPGAQDAQMRFLARSLATDSGNLRRFDDALDTLEDLLASRDDPAMLLGPLTDYLVVSIHYLLDVTEARIVRNYWVTAAPFMLETAIRLAPEEPFADEALALLELEMLKSYEGSDFEKLPPEDAQLLQELKRLVQAC
jgi:hypothetical protein